MSPALLQMVDQIAVLRSALAIANRAVVEDIEDECTFHWAGGHAWYDLTPMTDPREHSPQVCDMATEAIRYGIESGLLVRHPDPELPHLVRIVQPAQEGCPA